MTAAAGPRPLLTDAEALARLAHAERPLLLETALDALIVARAATRDPARAVEGRNALLLAAAALHLLLWGPPAMPGRPDAV
jgi:hypothetical protein